MMMPANYSVIAENEMTYVVGGGVIEAIGAVTAPIWTLDNVKTFNTNIVTIVGNAKLQNVVNKTLGYVFSGDANWKQLGQNLKGLFVAANGHFGDSLLPLWALLLLSTTWALLLLLTRLATLFCSRVLPIRRHTRAASTVRISSSPRPNLS